MLKSSASRIYSQLDTMTSEKSTRSLEKSADTFTMTAQTLMNSYNQMVQNVEYQEKRVESLQAAFEAMVRKQAAGTATQAQLKEAKKAWTLPEIPWSPSGSRPGSCAVGCLPCWGLRTAARW